MQAQQDKLNGNMQAFALAFSNVIKDATSHLATKDDIKELSGRIGRVETRLDGVETRLDGVETRLDKVEQTVAEGYKRIYSWKDDMYKNFPRKEDLKPSAFA